ncbi:MAG: hypothetical protein AB1458_06565 [Bacteroidota bacterium]
MKKTHLFVLSALFLLFTSSLDAGTIVIDGQYQDKNIYVQNSVASSGVGFCTYEVRVNGQTTNDEINSSAFEIDLTQRQLKFGDKVTIEIRYKDGCSPKVLNPEAVKPKPTFELISMSITPDGLLKWTTKGEQGSLPYIVEQFRWNKWVRVGEVDGKGTPGQHEYSFNVSLHSGENQFRVKQVGFTSSPKVSAAVKIVSSSPKLDYALNKNNKITFTDATMYEIYDYYGTIVKKGYGKDIDVSTLLKGGYYLCYDNQVTEFKKK